MLTEEELQWGKCSCCGYSVSPRLGFDMDGLCPFCSNNQEWKTMENGKESVLVAPCPCSPGKYVQMVTAEGGNKVCHICGAPYSQSNA